jgi:S-adenosylmethionine decarboxylase
MLSMTINEARKRPKFKDLAPEIVRQRMVLEGILNNSFTPEQMIRYCKEISKALNMTPVCEPTTDFAQEYGWCCFMHWKESGMHIYSWDNREPKFFSIDIYTCKKFAPISVVAFTDEFFGDNLIECSWKE